MKKYRVSVPISGYCRGDQIWEVEAETPEEAKEICFEGKMVEDVIVRDDRCHDDDRDYWDVRCLNE